MASGAAFWLDISHHKGTAYDLSAPVIDMVEVKKYQFSMSQRKIVLAAACVRACFFCVNVVRE
jgi:hypothetical protein